MTTSQTDAVAVATRVVLALSGRRWTWPKRQVTEIYWVPRTVSTALLSGRPVRSIISATGPDGVAIPYELDSAFRLTFPTLCGPQWPYWSYPAFDLNGGLYPSAWRRRIGAAVTVEYVYGSRPPIDIRIAIDQLATELEKLWAGQDCALPQRVSSVSREGVSWTVIDPMTFLEGGKTGLYYVDLILGSYGAKTPLRTRVFSPEHLPPKRLKTLILPLDPPDITDGPPESPRQVEMYQGEDWTQVLRFYSDAAQTAPLPFTNPVLQIRNTAGAVLATFDTAGSGGGTAATVGPGVLQLTMDYTRTAAIPGGTPDSPTLYDVDLFADTTSRRALVKRGYLQLAVIARITQDA